MKTHEQFDKLAEQCYVKTGSVHTDHFDYVKFAELIVRECAEKFAAEPDKPLYGRHVSYHILKHFGVLE